jgi:hypothetical protein
VAGAASDNRDDSSGGGGGGGGYAALESTVTTLGAYLETCRAAAEAADAHTPEAAAALEGAAWARPSLLPYGANNALVPALAASFALPLPFPATTPAVDAETPAVDAATAGRSQRAGVRPVVLLAGAYPAHACRFAHTRLWVGWAGSPGVHWHRDLQDNFIVGLFGGKRVWLAPPHATQRCFGRAVPVTPYLHEAARAAPRLPPPPPRLRGLPPLPPAAVHSASGDSSSGGVLEPVDVFAGDCLYVPAGWWHATENLPVRAGGNRGGDGGHSGGNRHGAVGTLNFFMPSCYAALGVVVPDLRGCGGGWLPGFEPAGVAGT